MRIIGITGTVWSGKGTVADYLVAAKWYLHYSVREFLEEILTKKWLPCDRDQMRQLANDLRAEHGPAYIIQQLYTKAFEVGQDAVIESLRCPGEVEALQGRDGFLLVAVDAAPRVRYERVVKRGLSTDTVSYDDFIRQEDAEMKNAQPFAQNIAACMAMADMVLYVDGDIATLEAEVEKRLFGVS
jgi:dephospho-CoA kinase